MYGFYAPYSHNYGRTTQNGFGGINANKSADNGEVLSLMDMTSDEYPLLATRPQRWRCGVYTGNIVGYGVSNGKRAYVTKQGPVFKFHYAGREHSFTDDASINRISIAAIGDFIVLYPVLKYFDIRSLDVMNFSGEDFLDNYGHYGSISNFDQTISYTDTDGVTKEHTFAEGEIFSVRALLDPSSGGTLYRHTQGMYRYSKSRAIFVGDIFGDMRDRTKCPITIENGEYAGESATGNVLKFNPQTTLEIQTARNTFRVGDAIKISGCTHEQCNKTVVIREIGDNGELIFYDNTFEMPEGETSFDESNAVVERDIPQLDVMFEHNNRVWGAQGRNIYCSKAGDPLIWSDYESLGDGCWWADSGNTEPYGITGGCSYTYPRFFSEKCIYTIYGDTPGEFTIIPTRAHGVLYGARDSLSVVNGMLIYLSPNGFMGYTGSLPQKLDYDLGNERIESAISITDGVKFYSYVKQGSMHLYVYDPARGIWAEESTPADIEGLWHIEELTMACGGHFWTLGRVREKPIDEGETDGYYGDTPHGKVKFADFTMETVGKKQLKDIAIRHEGVLEVRLFIDDEQDHSFTKTIRGEGKHVTELPCIPKRCDHWHLELEGDGPWVVYSIAANYLEGSTKK